MFINNKSTTFYVETKYCIILKQKIQNPQFPYIILSNPNSTCNPRLNSMLQILILRSNTPKTKWLYTAHSQEQAKWNAKHQKFPNIQKQNQKLEEQRKECFMDNETQFQKAWKSILRDSRNSRDKDKKHWNLLSKKAHDVIYQYPSHKLFYFSFSKISIVAIQADIVEIIGAQNHPITGIIVIK